MTTRTKTPLGHVQPPPRANLRFTDCFFFIPRRTLLDFDRGGCFENEPSKFQRLDQFSRPWRDTKTIRCYNDGRWFVSSLVVAQLPGRKKRAKSLPQRSGWAGDPHSVECNDVVTSACGAIRLRRLCGRASRLHLCSTPESCA